MGKRKPITKQRPISGIDMYMNRAFRFMIILIPLVALCSAAVLVGIRLMGYYPGVSRAGLTVFAASTVVYVLIAFWFYRNCEDEDGQLKPGMLEKGKIVIALIEVIQWNFISYLIPSRDFWAYGAYFAALTVMFLDHKFVLLVEGEILISMIISWIIRGDCLLPVRDELFVPEMTLRVVFLVLFCICLWLTTYLLQTILTRELERYADVDALTGLRSRRSMETEIRKLIEDKREKGGEFTLLMCDLDDFKAMNDTYGHDCGDEILKTVAKELIKGIQASGKAFRYGGEEFLVLLDADRGTALQAAEQMRSGVEATPTVYQGRPLTITLTIGAATWNRTKDMERLIKEADINLYYGKQHGKNRVIA